MKNWSREQQEKAGTLERNEHICWLVDAGGKGMQATLGRRYHLTRQRINQIYKRGKKESLWKRFIGWIKSCRRGK